MARAILLIKMAILLLILVSEGEIDMYEKHIVFLDVNTTSSGVAFLQGAKRLGLYITFVTFDPDYYQRARKPGEESLLDYADHLLVADTHYDMDTLVNLLSKYNQAKPIDGIFASMDLEMLPAALVAQSLGLPGNHPSAVAICRDKYRMRCTLWEHQIPSPRYALVRTIAEAQRAGERLGYPCVLKPINFTASEGVQMIMHPRDFVEPLQHYYANPLYDRGVQKAPHLLVEEYLEGPLLSVETVSYGDEIHVLGLTDRVLGPPPYFIELIASFPAVIPGIDEAVQMTVQTLKAIGYRFGPAHTELILTKDGPRIVEINPRLVGGAISFVMNHASGYSIHEEILKMHVGLPASFHTAYQGVGIDQLIPAPKSGIIRAFEGCETIASMPDILGFYPQKKVGDSVTSSMNKERDALALIAAFGSNKEMALTRVQEALAHLKVTIS